MIHLSTEAGARWEIDTEARKARRTDPGILIEPMLGARDVHTHVSPGWNEYLQMLPLEPESGSRIRFTWAERPEGCKCLVPVTTTSPVVMAVYDLDEAPGTSRT